MMLTALTKLSVPAAPTFPSHGPGSAGGMLGYSPRRKGLGTGTQRVKSSAGEGKIPAQRGSCGRAMVPRGWGGACPEQRVLGDPLRCCREGMGEGPQSRRAQGRLADRALLHSPRPSPLPPFQRELTPLPRAETSDPPVTPARPGTGPCPDPRSRGASSPRASISRELETIWKGVKNKTPSFCSRRAPLPHPPEGPEQEMWGFPPAFPSLLLHLWGV